MLDAEVSLTLLQGTVERITFQNEETGYTVAHLLPLKGKETVCIVGIMPLVHAGASLAAKGNFKDHPLYGPQFVVDQYDIQTPATSIGIEKYLSSSLVKGIGPVFAKKIVEKFGIHTLDIIDQTPEKLQSIPKLGKKRIEILVKSLKEQKSMRDVMVFLQSHGITPAYAQRIYKVYGEKTIENLQKNPFLLAKEIDGIGFKMADKIAKEMGLQEESKERIGASIDFLLQELGGFGHVCYPFSSFLELLQDFLKIDQLLIEKEIENLRQEEKVVVFPLVFNGKEEPFIFSSPLFLAETGIAKELKRLLFSPSFFRTIDKEKALAWVQKELEITLAEEQKKAILTAIEKKVQIITGGPGTGKSTITHAILTIFEKLTSKIILAAPTGRAAYRLSEITHKKAYTIHSLLEFDFARGKFKRDRKNPLDCDLVIVDEASMIDTFLMYSLLKAIPSTSKVIFVGDIFQLPSVGPGNVLKDLILSRMVPVTLLNEIFRQALGSQIVVNAHRINQGVFPDLQKRKDSDFFFLEAEEQEVALSTLLQLVSVRLPVKYRLDPLKEIQVLTPMKKGKLGTQNLNLLLQKQMNPKASSSHRFFPGDKVMQIRNNYKKEVYNGDIGFVENIEEDGTIHVFMHEKMIPYSLDEQDELVLAYAVSVHKYQGSECPCIVIPIDTSHFKLLHRNLLYTAVTRGKKLVVLVGSKKALGMAVRNDEVKNRFTGLTQALYRIFE